VVGEVGGEILSGLCILYSVLIIAFTAESMGPPCANMRVGSTEQGFC
jgi:hypothetical protein